MTCDKTFSTLWSLSFYPSDNGVIVTVRCTVLYNTAIASLLLFCFFFLFLGCYHVFLMHKNI